MKKSFKGWIVRNWPLKLVSLFLAFVLWLVIVPAQKMYSEKVLTIPLEARNIPSQLEIVEFQTSTIDVTLRAPNRLIDEIGPSGLVARVDLERATPYQQEYPLNMAMIAVPPGAEVVKINPNKVTIKLERTREERLVIRPSFRGKPAAGFRTGSTKVEPVGVLVRGPESRINAKDEATTAPIDLSGLTDTTVFDADIILPRPELRLVSPQTSARVTVTVEPDKAAAKAAPAKKSP